MDRCLSIVVPCRDEATTVVACIEAAQNLIAHACTSGEVIVVDNASSDGSGALAAAAGARVVVEHAPGYGNAVLAGVRAARFSIVAMADCDGSYDFQDLSRMLDEIATGADLVMGNRLQGCVAPGAMPTLHRLIGSPALNVLAGFVAGQSVGDVNCGIRAFRGQSILDLNLRSSGMELASEMVVRAVQSGYDVRHVPVSLQPDARTRGQSHLRPFRDGLRHLKILAACGLEGGV